MSHFRRLIENQCHTPPPSTLTCTPVTATLLACNADKQLFVHYLLVKPSIVAAQHTLSQSFPHLPLPAPSLFLLLLACNKFSAFVCLMPRVHAAHVSRVCELPVNCHGFIVDAAVIFSYSYSQSKSCCCHSCCYCCCCCFSCCCCCCSMPHQSRATSKRQPNTRNRKITELYNSISVFHSFLLQLSLSTPLPPTLPLFAYLAQKRDRQTDRHTVRLGEREREGKHIKQHFRFSILSNSIEQNRENTRTQYSVEQIHPLFASTLDEIHLPPPVLPFLTAPSSTGIGHWHSGVAIPGLGGVGVRGGGSQSRFYMASQWIVARR